MGKQIGVCVCVRVYFLAVAERTRRPVRQAKEGRSLSRLQNDPFPTAGPREWHIVFAFWLCVTPRCCKEQKEYSGAVQHKVILQCAPSLRLTKLTIADGV